MKRLLSSLLIPALAACGEPRAAPPLPPPRVEWTAEDAARAAEGWIPVRILLDGAPCSGALLQAGAFPELRLHDSVNGGRHLLRMRESDPGVVRADARGVAWWRPESGQLFWLRAAAGERMRLEVLSPHFQREAARAAHHGLIPLHLELWPIRTWDIRVQGPPPAQPQSVPVYLGLEKGPALERLAWSGDGAATSVHPAVYFQGNGSTGQLEIWAGFDRARARRISPSEKARALSFDLRATGSMRVELAALDGARVLEPRAVFVREAGAGSPGHRGCDVASYLGWPSVVAQEGIAVLHGLPLGKRWEIGAALLPEQVVVTAEAAGPARPGEVTEFRLSAAACCETLRGRLLEPDGSPAAHAEARLLRKSCSLAFQTDADGRFAASVPGLMMAQGGGWRIESRVRGADVQKSVQAPDETWRSGAEPADFIWREELDEVLATGRIVDEAGAPLPDAEVYDAEAADTDWSDARGQFVLRGTPAHGTEVEIAARTPWHRSEAVRIRAGQREVLLRAVTCARIAGRLADASSAMLLGWTVVRGDGSVETDYAPFSWLWEGGLFELGPIPADATELRVDFGAAGVAVVKDLRLTPGALLRLPAPLQPAR